MSKRPLVMAALFAIAICTSSLWAAAVVPAGDFNNDGHSDLVWRNAQTGNVTQWYMNGAVPTPQAPLAAFQNGAININFHIAGVADFDHDGFADLLWHNIQTGEVVIWRVQNNTVMSFTAVGSVNTAYGIEAIGDFNGDSIPDILWRNTTSGAWVMWLMNNTFGVASVSVGSVDPNYKLEAVPDLDGNGKADMVWHEQTGDGQIAVFMMDGGTVTNVILLGGVKPHYHVEAAGDFDGDGKTDLMWHSAVDGGTVAWLMDATQVSMVRSVGVLTGSPGSSANAHIEAVGDFDGDTKADVVWRDPTTGMVTLWRMNGSAIGTITSLGGIDTRVEIEGPTHLARLAPLPSATNESHSVQQNGTLTVAAPGVFSNDTLNGAVLSSNSSPAHGTATVNADGSFTYTPTAGYSGPDSFIYTIANFSGSATATVNLTVITCSTITVTRNGGGTFPAGVFNSAYTGQSFTATGGTGPYAFAVTAGTFPPGLTLNGNGTISGTPTATGTYTNFTVTATDSATCSGSAQFTIAINPAAVTDTYSNLINNTQAVVTGGTTLSPGTPFVPLTGFIGTNDLPSGGVAVVAGTVSSTNGTNNVVIAADGSFLYTPPVTASALASDSFTYTISSNTGATPTPTSANGTVTLNLLNRVWYVKNNAAGGGNGQSQSPFITLVAAQTASTAGDIIFVYDGDGTTTGQNAGITLKNNQKLIGEAAGLTVNTFTLVGAGVRPSITNATANSDAVTLADGNTVKGLEIDSATRDGIAGLSHADFTIDDVFLQNNVGSGLHFTSMTGTITITNTHLSNNGVDLDVNNGTAAITFDSTNFLHCGAGRSISIQNRPASAGAIDIGVSFDDDGSGMLINNNASGIINFTGTQTFDTFTNTAVTITSNTGTTINFSGDLEITTTTGNGFVATGGGTLNVSGTAAKVTTGAATASVNIDGMTVGGSGVKFTAVNTTGATTGVALTNVGGTVSVTGGTISNGTTGISLQGASTNLSLAGVTITGPTTGITNTTNFGTLTIGSSVSVSAAQALTLTTGAVTGTFASVTATAGGVSLTGVTGTWGAAAGSLTGVAGSPTFNVSGGSGGTITWAPTISQANANKAINIAGSNSNTINFNGDVSSTGSSTGATFTASSGAYNLNGTNTFSGAGGISITNGESGTIAFSANTTNTTTGDAFTVDGTPAAVTAAITYSGTINKATTGFLVNVNNLDNPGTLTMTHAPAAAGNLTQSVPGNGISITNSSSTNITIADASVTFGSTAAGFTSNGNAGGTLTLNGLALVGSGNKAGMVLVGGGTINVNSGAAAPSINVSAGSSNAIDGTGFTGTLSINNTTITGNNSATVVTMNGGTLNGTGNTIPSVAATALSLTNVASGVTFASITTTGGVNGIALTTCSGTLTISGGALSGATGATFAVVGGTIGVTDAGTIAQAAASQPVISVTAGHATGTLTFNGSVSATNGTGLHFDNADGIYNINNSVGALSLSGGDAGIDITNGSGGAFTFGSAGTHANINNPTGTGFVANGSTASVTYNGDITKSGTSVGLVVDITNEASGTITFQNGTITDSSSAGTGINLNNADGTVNFNGTVTLSGGSNGVSINTGSSGTFNFSSASSITNPGTTAFNVNASAPTSIAYAGSITNNGGRAVSISNGAAAACVTGGGSLSFSGNISGSGATATGILVNNCNAGIINFSGATKTFSTQTNQAVTLTNQNGVTVNFTGNNLNLTTTSAATFTATGGGTINVTGTGNTLTAGTGNAITATSVTLGMTLQSVTATGGATGIVLTGTSGSLSVTGTSSGLATGTGGSISNVTTRAIHSVNSSGTLSFSSMNLSLNTAADGGVLIDNNTSGNLTVNFTGCTFTGVTASVSQNKSLLQYEAGNAAVLTANVQNSYFNGSRTYGFFATGAGTSVVNATVNQCGFGTDVNAGAPVNQPGTTITNPPAFALGVTNGSSANVTYNITNNTFWGASGLLGAIYAVTISGASTTGSSNLSGSINFNKIGKTGVVGSGCSNNCAAIGLLVGSQGTFNATVSGNDIRQVNSLGIQVFFPNAGSSGTSIGHITNNTITEPDTTGSPLFQRGIVVTTGNSGGTSMTACTQITGNNISGAWQAGNFIRVTTLNTTGVLTIPGLTPLSGATGAQVDTYLESVNTIGAGNSNTTVGGAINGSAAPCP